MKSQARPQLRPRPRPRPRASHAHALIAVLIAAGVVLRVVHFPVEVYTPDEDAYANFYARPMFEHGLGELPKLVRDYNARPDMSQFPSPTRAGHLWAIVGFMNLAGRATIQNAAWVSAIASMLILLLVARIGLGFLEPGATAIALLFAVVSPLDLAMARRAWGDELFALCALAATAAFLEYAAGAQRGRWKLLSLGLAGYSILIKETGLVVLALATFGFVLVAWRALGLRAAVTALFAGLATLLVSAAVLTATCGGIEPLRATLARVGAANTLNEYMRSYQTGGPGYYARGLGLLHPLPVVLGALGALAVALRIPRSSRAFDRPRARAALVTLAWFTILFAAVALAWPQKNMRFLSPIYAPLDLIAGSAVWTALEGARNRLPPAAFRVVLALGAAALLGAAVADHQRFVELFIRRGIPDLATPWFTRAPA